VSCQGRRLPSSREAAVRLRRSVRRAHQVALAVVRDVAVAAGRRQGAARRVQGAALAAEAREEGAERALRGKAEQLVDLAWEGRAAGEIGALQMVGGTGAGAPR